MRCVTRGLSTKRFSHIPIRIWLQGNRDGRAALEPRVGGGDRRDPPLQIPLWRRLRQGQDHVDQEQLFRSHLVRSLQCTARVLVNHLPRELSITGCSFLKRSTISTRSSFRCRAISFLRRRRAFWYFPSPGLPSEAPESLSARWASLS